MINPFKEVNWKPTLSDRRKFGLSLIIGCPSVAGVLLIIGRLKSGVWAHNAQLALWIGLVGILAGLLCMALPRLATPLYLVVYLFACCMGLIVGNLLLSGLYYLLLTPLGMARRVAGRPSFQKHFDRNATSYWQDVKSREDPADYFRQF